MCNKLEKERDMERSCLMLVTDLIGGGDHAAMEKAKKMIAEETSHAMSVLVGFLRNKSWKERKILPQKWHLYSTEAKTFCVQVMESISDVIPGNWDNVFFWHIVIVPKVRNFYNRLRSEMSRKIKANVAGTLLHIVCKIIMVYSHVMMNSNIYCN